MRFDILTIFPDIFSAKGGYFSRSLMARAQKKRLIKIVAHDLRRYAKDKHKTVDDRPYGGGVGMVMKVDVVFKALTALKKIPNSKFQITNPEGDVSRPYGAGKLQIQNTKYQTRTILLTPQGKVFNQKTAKRLAKYDRLILVSGRYEGYDERIRKLADEEISIGDYVLTGGELPVMVVVDAVARLVPGVVGKEQSLAEESFSKNLLEYPQYTRPAVFRNMKVPKVLLSGDHKKIREWREKEAIQRTKRRRPDLLKNF
ncbi:MAG: tRNA (guanosine(37)-N1)-methyltransferase TrmD [Candidatus Doudnabacteria bacterium]|nr:tRNA (guanosine(37)-N1)-methyltransferase TrmD [Candidatus Doudnabacteria bacterium]